MTPGVLFVGTIPTMIPGVLVVDDEQGIRDMVGMMIRGHSDYPVTAVAGGRDAVVHLSADPDWSLILLDLWMENGDGNDVLAWMADHKNKTPVVIVTGRIDRLRDEFQMMVRDVLHKPFTFDRLKSVLDRFGVNKKSSGVA